MSAAKPPSASAGKKRGLGRGLEALLGPKAAAEAPLLEATPQDALRSLPIDALAPANTSRAGPWTTPSWPNWPNRSRPRA